MDGMIRSGLELVRINCGQTVFGVRTKKNPLFGNSKSDWCLNIDTAVTDDILLGVRHFSTRLLISKKYRYTGNSEN